MTGQLESVAVGEEAAERFLLRFAGLPDGAEMLIRVARKREPKDNEPEGIILLQCGDGPTLGLDYDQAVDVALIAGLISRILEACKSPLAAPYRFLEAKLLEAVKIGIEAELLPSTARH